jgi:hypothetical protein
VDRKEAPGDRIPPGLLLRLGPVISEPGGPYRPPGNRLFTTLLKMDPNW